MKAREVFQDCQYARNRFQESLEEEKLPEAKIFWFASLALLRAIGHVLHNVDSQTLGDKFQEVLNERFSCWKRDPMFTNFIENERNNILKEYSSSLSEIKESKDVELVTESGENIVTESGEDLLASVLFNTLIKGTGEYKGMHPIEVLDRALAWWDEELTALENVSS